MKAGIVVTIRVNPRDCQSILDLMDMLHMRRDGHSFSHLTSMSLSSLLETMRVEGKLPEPDPYQFGDRLSAYVGQPRTSKKLQTAKVISDMGSQFRAPTLQKVPTVPKFTPDQERAMLRVQELEIQKEHNPLNWSAEMQAELDLLRDTLPEGG